MRLLQQPMGEGFPGAPSLPRHGIARLPDVEGDKPERQTVKRCHVGFFHIDIAGGQTAEGKLYLAAGIGGVSGFAAAQPVATADRTTAWQFQHDLLKAVPYQVHTVLTDNGIRCAEQPRNRNTICSRPMRFDMICGASGIEHRLEKPSHPRTSGQAGRRNRTIKDGEADQKPIRGVGFPLNVTHFHHDNHGQP